MLINRDVLKPIISIWHAWTSFLKRLHRKRPTEISMLQLDDTKALPSSLTLRERGGGSTAAKKYNKKPTPTLTSLKKAFSLIVLLKSNRKLVRKLPWFLLIINNNWVLFTWTFSVACENLIKVSLNTVYFALIKHDCFWHSDFFALWCTSYHMWYNIFVASCN